MPEITNTAGEQEPETRSRHFNFQEGLGVMALVLVLLWPVAYAGDILGGQRWITSAVQLALALVFVFILFISPRIHGERLDSWGLGNPRTLRAVVAGRSGWRRRQLLGTVIAIFIALNLANYWQWPRVARFFELHKLGLDPDPQTWHRFFPGRFAVVAAGLVISSIITGFMIRYDNFGSAFKTALKVSLPLLAIIFLSAWLHRGAEAFEGLTLAGWLLGVLGYVYWGAVQQIVFSGYFGGRFRKAFPPGALPENTVGPGKRWRVITAFGAFFSIVGVIFIGRTIYVLYGTAHLDPGALVWIAILLFLGGAAYGFWYCRDKRRVLVATLTGACFGLIHIDSYGLVLATWGLGTVLAFVFMEDANRNVVALGFIHGLLGSSLGALFSAEKSGTLEIDYTAGPWNIEEPTRDALVIPLGCIGILAAMMVAAAIRHFQNRRL